MRILILLLSLTLCACAAATPPVPTTDAELKAEAEQLIRYSLTERLIQNTEHYYRDQITGIFASKKDVMPEVNKILDEELKALVEDEHARLVEGLVPVYQRVFTAEEIHQLLSFYRTEVARKSIRVSTQIASESQQYIRNWSEHFGDELLNRVDTRLSAAGIKLDN